MKFFFKYHQMAVSSNTKDILINLRFLIKKIIGKQNKNENKNLDWINFKYIILQDYKIRKEIEIEVS